MPLSAETARLKKRARSQPNLTVRIVRFAIEKQYPTGYVIMGIQEGGLCGPICNAHPALSSHFQHRELCHLETSRKTPLNRPQSQNANPGPALCEAMPTKRRMEFSQKGKQRRNIVGCNDVVCFIEPPQYNVLRDRSIRLSLCPRCLPSVQIRHKPHSYQNNPDHRSIRSSMIQYWVMSARRPRQSSSMPLIQLAFFLQAGSDPVCEASVLSE